MTVLNLDVNDFNIDKIRSLTDGKTGEPLTEKQVEKAVQVMNKYRTEKDLGMITYKERSKLKPILMQGQTPCSTCGCTEMNRTGTCFVCLSCGSSQGCS